MSAGSPDAAVATQERRLRTSVLWVLAALVLAVTLIFAVPSLRGVGHRITSMSPGWVLLAVALELVASYGYVRIFRCVFGRVPRRLASRLAWAELAFGAALPVGGVGGIAFGAWVLRNEGMRTGELADRSAVLYLVTSAVNAVVLIAAGLGLWLGVLSGPDDGGVGLSLIPAVAAAGVVAIVGLLALGAAWLAPRVPPRWARALRGLARTVAGTRTMLVEPSRGLGGAFAYLLCDIGVLWACLHALGNPAPVAPVVLAYLIGSLANWVPTPAGIGALDGGLIGMLLLYDVPAASAAAAVLVYHAIVFWIRTLIGGAAFFALRRELSHARA